MKKISFSILKEEKCLGDFLKKILSLSQSSLKKLKQIHNLNKKFLESSCTPKKEYSLPIEIINHGSINPHYTGSEVKLLKDEQSWLALSKPANCHIHPLDYADTNNLLSYLRKEGNYSCLNVNKNHYDRGILYRLDFETSGVVIIAKTDHLYNSVRDNFKFVSKRKVYFAVVKGEYLGADSLNHNLSTTGKKVKEDIEGKSAYLEVENLSYNKEKNISLLKISLKEGLRHQIRVQLSLAGYPILGDSLYGGDESDRLYLHAYEYFLEVNNEEIKVNDRPDHFLEFFTDLDSRFNML